MSAVKTLRVANIIYDDYPYEVRVRRLAEAASDAGYEVDALAPRQEGQPSREVCNGVTTYRISPARKFDQSLPANVFGWLRFTIQAGALVARLHLRNRYDVIHVHNMPDFLVFSALVPKLLGARVILDVQDVSPELMAAKSQGKLRGVMKWLAIAQERASVQFADVVVTTGWPFTRALLGRGIPASKVRSVLNSADPRLFPASRRFSPDDALRPVTAPHDDSAPFVVMYWGTIAPRNGLATAIRALALAAPQAPNMRLDIMADGRGDEVPKLKRLAAQLNVADRIRFTDPVPGERIVDFIAHGDVGIIPYRVDGFADIVLPTKAYEMAWLRRPIVASDTFAIRSMFRPESISLCQPDDPQSFAEALLDLYNHPEKRRAMVENAASDYEPYRWEDEAQRYVALLADLVRSPRMSNASASAAQEMAGPR